MKANAPGDAARVSVFVAVSPADAFAVFTEEIDQWWRHGRRFRIAGRHPGRMILEGGRLFESVDRPREEGGPTTHEVGRVLVWDPPRRLELSWRNLNFRPDEETFVDVTFTPQGDGTLVSVCHHGWSALPDGHPARHGLDAPAFSRMMGMWWADLMRSLREHLAARASG